MAALNGNNPGQKSIEVSSAHTALGDYAVLLEAFATRPRRHL